MICLWPEAQAVPQAAYPRCCFSTSIKGAVGKSIVNWFLNWPLIFRECLASSFSCYERQKFSLKIDLESVAPQSSRFVIKDLVPHNGKAIKCVSDHVVIAFVQDIVDDELRSYKLKFLTLTSKIFNFTHDVV